MTLEEINRFRESQPKGFIETLGIVLLEVKEGYAKGSMKVNQAHKNVVGSIHGGCMFTLADTVGGIAALTHGWKVVTASSEIHYLRPALHSTELFAEATELKNGRQMSVYEVDVTDDTGCHLAKVTLTFMRLDERIL